MYSQFQKDFDLKGKPCEEAVLAYIQKWDISAYIVKGYDVGKDIISPKTQKTFEVKNCQDAKVNVPIEISIINRNGEHLSGLNVSTATYWVIYCKNTYFMILTPVLREIVKDIPEKEYTIHDQLVTLKILPILLLRQKSKHYWQKEA